MGYFNMFDEWAMDPKVQSMSEPMQRRHLMLLCLRNIGDTSETPDDEVATFMRISLSEVRKTKSAFKAKGFIDGSGWNVIKWDKRQSGHSESYDRVKRYREKRKPVTCNVTETFQSNGSNVTETLPCNPPARADLLTNVLTSVTNLPPPDPPEGGEVVGDFAELDEQAEVDARALGKWAISLTSDLSMGRAVLGWARMRFSLPVIRRALEEGFAANNIGHKFVLGIIRRLDKNGIPEVSKFGGKPGESAKPLAIAKGLDDPEFAAAQAAKQAADLKRSEGLKKRRSAQR